MTSVVESDSLRRYIALLVFTVGVTTLGAEIAAARLLAPYFGASTIVWANTIATVLTALAIGYWLGGKLADRSPHLVGLCQLALVASLLIAAVPYIAKPALGSSISAFDSLSAGAFIGSLVAVLVLIALPVALLGATSPYALRLIVERVEDSGSTAGRLYAVSTVGSLLGTFLSSLLLIPAVGTTRTFLIFALALAAVAAVGIFKQRRSYLVAPMAVAGLLFVPTGVVKGSGDDRVIYESQTRYQYARVTESESGVRRLELNEGQAVHSVYRPDSYLVGDYWDEMLVLPELLSGQAPKRIAVLGNAAGTTARAYGKFYPETQVDGVEIDPKLSELGREFFDLNSKSLTLHAADARPFLRRSKHRYDAILIDAYRQPYVPFYLATKEFFELCKDRLTANGVVLINVGHPEGSEVLEKALTATIKDVFGHVLRDPVSETNTVVAASNYSFQRSLARPNDRFVPGLILTATEAEGRLEPALAGGEVMTDDHAPVEWLIDRSLVEYAVDSGK